MSRRAALIAVLAALALGMMVRIALHAQNKSLWIDEAVLADNLVRKSYAELGRPLDHHQAAPIGFLWAQRLAVQTLGTGERVLRLAPLLAGLLLLPAVYLLARRLLTSRAAIIALLLVAASQPLIDFGNEVKPYIFDALAATVVLWLAVRAAQRAYDLGAVAALALGGSVALWLSFPVVFVIAGVMTCLIVDALRRPDRAARIRLGLAAAACAASFAANFLLFIRHAAGSEALHSFWKSSNAFPPLPPTSLRDGMWYIWTPLNYFVDPGGFHAIGAAVLLTLLGAFVLWRGNRLMLGLLLSPFVVTLAAAAIQKYPFPTAPTHGEHWFGRVLLFALPAVLILIALGVDQLAHIISTTGASNASATRWHRGRAVIGIFLLIILIHPVHRAMHELRSSSAGRDVRATFEHLAKHQKPDDRVFPTWPVRQLAAYYRHRIPISDPDQWISKHPVLVTDMMTRDAWARSQDWTQMEAEISANAGHRLWMFVSHEPSTDSHADERFLKYVLNRHGVILDQLVNDEASLYLVHLHPDK